MSIMAANPGAGGSTADAAPAQSAVELDAALSAEAARRLERRKRKTGWGAAVDVAEVQPPATAMVTEQTSIDKAVGSTTAAGGQVGGTDGTPADASASDDSAVGATVSSGDSAPDGAVGAATDSATTENKAATAGDGRRRRRRSGWGDKAVDESAAAAVTAGAGIGVAAVVAAASGQAAAGGNPAAANMQALMQRMAQAQQQQLQAQAQQNAQQQLLQQQMAQQQMVQMQQQQMVAQQAVQHQAAASAAAMTVAGSGVGGSASLFVSNIGLGVTEELLKEHFCKIGAVLQAGMLKDDKTGLPNGFFLVEYAAAETAARALQALNGLEVGGKELRIVQAPGAVRAAAPVSLVGRLGGPLAAAQAQANAQLQLQLRMQMQQLQVRAQMLAGQSMQVQVLANPMLRMTIHSQLQQTQQSMMQIQMQLQAQQAHSLPSGPFYQQQAVLAAAPAALAAQAAEAAVTAPGLMLSAADSAKLTVLVAKRTAAVISSIHTDLSADDLTAVFSAFGPILEVRLDHRDPGPAATVKTRSALVVYQENQAAADAVEHMNGFELAGEKLVVAMLLDLRQGATVLGTPAKVGLLGAGPGANGPGAVPSFSAYLSTGMGGGAGGGSGALAQPGTGGADSSLDSETNIQISAAQRYQLMRKLSAQQAGQESAALAASTVVLLLNMVGSAAEADQDFREEVAEESRSFGVVQKVLAHDAGPPLGVKVFVQFAQHSEAAAARSKMHGRFFGGKQIKAEFVDDGKFSRGDYS